MKNISLSIVFAALLPFGSSAAQAEAIGRVLVAVGDTSALRNGAMVKLARGAEVQSGDTLRTGETSNMQVRFTDESITALRSNSEFRIDDYKFEGGTNVGKSFFSLVKGGMRSITGLIGRFNRENYAVKASTATIGIRGTHFVLAQCSNDCFNKDGSQAENGLFGGVTDGRIAVNNQSGEKEFGKNEFFHVPSSDTSPKPLLTPPSFLRDQLEGQAKSKEGKATVAKAAAAGDGSAETAAAGGETTDTTTAQQTGTAATTQPTGETALVEVAVNTGFVPTEQTVVQSNVSAGAIGGPVHLAAGQSAPYQITMANAWAGKNNWSNSFGSGTNIFGYSEAFLDQGTLTVIDPTKLMTAKDGIFVDYVANQIPLTTLLMNAYSVSGTSDYYHMTGNCGWNCTGTLAGTESFSWAKTASTDTGSNAVANLSWGRFTHTFSGTVLTGTYAGNTDNETSYEHWATGDLLSVAALPTSGWYTWSHVGGTRPTDQEGNMGTAVSGGIVGIEFTGANGALVTLTQATWTMPVTGNSYSVGFSNQPVSITQQPYTFNNSGWSEVGTATSFTPITVGATCSGTCSNNSTPIPVASRVAPMLFGANAEGLAAAISTNIAVPTGTSPAETTASVQMYTKDATPQAR